MKESALLRSILVKGIGMDLRFVLGESIRGSGGWRAAVSGVDRGRVSDLMAGCAGWGLSALWSAGVSFWCGAGVCVVVVFSFN